MLTPGHQQPEELSSLCYRKGWHGFPIGWGARLVPSPMVGVHALGQQHGPIHRALCDSCGRPAAQALVAAGPGSWCPRSRPGREMPEQSPHRLPCGPVLAGHRQPAASQLELAAGQGRARCKAQRPHHTERAGRQPAESHLQLRIPSRTQNARLFTLQAAVMALLEYTINSAP